MLLNPLDDLRGGSDGANIVSYRGQCAFVTGLAVAANCIVYQNNAIAAEEAVAQRGVNTDIGCNAADNQIFNTVLAQGFIKLGLVKTTEGVLVDDDFAIGRTFLVKVGAPSAFYTAAFFAALVLEHFVDVFEVVVRAYPDN